MSDILDLLIMKYVISVPMHNANDHCLMLMLNINVLIHFFFGRLMFVAVQHHPGIVNFLFCNWGT